MTTLTTRTHTLKTVEPYFSALAACEKTFEVRRNDRAFQKGDTLLLIDWDSCNCGSTACEKRRPPITRVVSFVFAGDPSLRDLGGIAPGYVILGLVDPVLDRVAVGPTIIRGPLNGARPVPVPVPTPEGA